ncbi:MAG: hypothetical protein Kow0037_02540 [Calditrichia bacterium]
MRTIFKPFFVIFIALFLFSCQQKSESAASQQTPEKNQAKVATSTKNSHKITFVELGSVNCIPCRMMQPVMQNIEHRYGDQIKVIFYDVWKEENKKYAKQYNIRLIPTQVFLDASGKEIMRHEGFFPEEEIDDFLQKQGLQPIN